MIVFSFKKTLSPRSIEINEVFCFFDGGLRWREGVDRQVYRGGETVQDTEPGKALSTKLNRLSDKKKSENLSEEPDAGNPQVRFCEGPGPTDAWLKYCGTAGKPGG